MGVLTLLALLVAYAGTIRLVLWALERARRDSEEVSEE